MAIPPRTRRQLGFGDPAKPEVRLNIHFNSPRQVKIRASTIDSQIVRAIMSEVPQSLFARLAGRVLTVTYDYRGFQAKQDRVVQTDDAVVRLGRCLAPHLKLEFETMVAAIAMQPEKPNLRAELRKQVVKSVAYLQAQGDFDRELVKSRFVCVLMSPDSCRDLDSAELAAAVHPFNLTAKQRGDPYLFIPVVGFADTDTNNPYLARANLYLDMATDAMLKQLTPRMKVKLGIWREDDEDARVAFVEPLTPWRAMVDTSLN